MAKEVFDAFDSCFGDEEDGDIVPHEAPKVAVVDLKRNDYSDLVINIPPIGMSTPAKTEDAFCIYPPRYWSGNVKMAASLTGGNRCLVSTKDIEAG